MKKTVLTILLIGVCSSFAFAQGYSQKDKILNIGAGFGLAGIYGDAALPPISVGLQFGLNEKISVGGLVGYAGSSYDFPGFGKTYTWDYTYIIVGGRGEYHFMEPSNELDAYAGLTLGYAIVSVSEPDGFNGAYSAEGSFLLYGFHAGARYALSESLGVFAEAGYGVGYLTAGLFLKL